MDSIADFGRKHLPFHNLVGAFRRKADYKHDFRLFKESHAYVLPDTLLEADTGNLGLTDLHANSNPPEKRSKKHPLTKQERRDNREVSRQRIFVEHAIRFG